eukprot:2645121-Rhodomonas_salina.5
MLGRKREGCYLAVSTPAEASLGLPVLARAVLIAKPDANMCEISTGHGRAVGGARGATSSPS